MAVSIPFEVLSQPIVPGVPNIPFVQQGTFIQVSNTLTTVATVGINYFAAPAFVAADPSGTLILTANYIDGNGNVTMVPANAFLAPPVGFGQISIPAGATYIFGVQYIIKPGSSANLAGGTPQEGLGSRGYAVVTVSDPNAVILATVRQVFNNFNPQGGLLDISEAAYALPITPAP